MAPFFFTKEMKKMIVKKIISIKGLVTVIYSQMLTIKLQAGACLDQWRPPKVKKLSSESVYYSRLDFPIVLLVNAPKGNIPVRKY